MRHKTIILIDKAGSSMKSRGVEEERNLQKSSVSPLSQKDLSNQLVQKDPTNIRNQEDQRRLTNQENLADRMQSKGITQQGDAKRKITRAVPVEIKRKIWERDGGCCQYKDPKTGKRCGSTYKLELDHVKPWSIGGDHSLENLWILCRNHNVYRWNCNIVK